jgi:hypothetical protein
MHTGTNDDVPRIVLEAIGQHNAPGTVDLLHTPHLLTETDVPLKIEPGAICFEVGYDIVV